MASNYFAVLAPQITGYVINQVQQRLPGAKFVGSKPVHDQLVDWFIILIAVLGASLAAFLTNYVDKPFGSVEDYAISFLWGLGIEKTIRGFTAAFTVLNAK